LTFEKQSDEIKKIKDEFARLGDTLIHPFFKTAYFHFIRSSRNIADIKLSHSLKEDLWGAIDKDKLKVFISRMEPELSKSDAIGKVICVALLLLWLDMEKIVEDIKKAKADEKAKTAKKRTARA
jgi:hypothetical protein